jgi:ferredoxin
MPHAASLCTLRFCLPDRPLVETTVPAGTLLIDAIRVLTIDGQLSLAWRCGRGTCGACRVQLAHPGQHGGATVSFTAMERNVLQRIGALPAEPANRSVWPDTPHLPRLACHVRCPAGMLDVSY